MEKNIAIILALNTLTVVFGWVIYLAGVPPNTNLFIFAAESIALLGLISLIVTLIYLFLSGERNRAFWPAISILIAGIVVVFFNWFAGGIVILTSLLLLILSKTSTYKKWLSLGLTFSGFIILAIVPPLEVLLNVYILSMDFVLITIASGIIISGLYLFSRKYVYVEGALSYIVLAMSFFLLPAFHEIFGIKSNGSFGIYDSAIIITSTIVYVIFALALVYLSNAREKIVKKIDEGYRLLENGKWEDAYALFRGVAEEGYKDDRLFNGMGVALMRMSKFEDAEAFIRGAIKLKDEDIYLTNLGNLYYRKGELEEAINIYSKVLKRNPNCYLALNNMGRALLKKGDVEKAEMYLKKAIKINPKGEIAKKNYSLINGK